MPRNTFARSSRHAKPAIGLVLAVLLPVAARCQITPAQANQLREGINDRIEALTVLGGDYVLGGGSFRSTSAAELKSWAALPDREKALHIGFRCAYPP